MYLHTSHSFLLLVLSLLASLALAITTAATATATTTTTTTTAPAATGSALFSAVPITSPNSTALSNFTAQWTLSLALYNASSSDSNLTTNLALSWPPGTGPNPNWTTSRITVNVVWLFGLVPHNFTGLDSSADGSGNCTALLGAACAHDVGEAALDWGLGNRPGRPVFRIPGSCASIHSGSVPSAGAALALSPANSSVLWSSYDATDPANASAVFETARRRVWPVFVIEQVYNGDNTVGGTGNMACPQALNLTGAGILSASSTTTSSTTAGGMSTSTGAAVTSTASVSSGGEKIRRIQAAPLSGMVMGTLLLRGLLDVLFW